MPKLISLLGLFFIIGVAWLLSTDRKHISRRVIVGGLLLQFAFGFFTLKTDLGLYIFSRIGDFFNVVLNYVNAGSAMVFGPRFAEFYFAFKVLPTIIFFSALMSVAYHMGLMQWIVQLMSRLMQATLRTSGAESLASAANIFVGQTEAPLVIKPYLLKMTRSEIHCVMVGGFANIAGGVLAAYVGMGVDAGHLVTCSVISAPASLMLAKIMVPETGKPETLKTTKFKAEKVGTNVLEAAAIGTTDGLHLALNVGAMLIAFLALIAMADGIIGWVGAKFHQQWALASVLSYVFWPFAYMIGVDVQDCFHVAHLLGLKMVTNEFVAYEQFSKWLKPDSVVQLTERSKMLTTYALCGFANFSSIGIQLGGIGALVPERRTDLAQLGFRAMIGGTLTTQMCACIAGILL